MNYNNGIEECWSNLPSQLMFAFPFLYQLKETSNYEVLLPAQTEDGEFIYRFWFSTDIKYSHPDEWNLLNVTVFKAGQYLPIDVEISLFCIKEILVQACQWILFIDWEKPSITNAPLYIHRSEKN